MLVARERRVLGGNVPKYDGTGSGGHWTCCSIPSEHISRKIGIFGNIGALLVSLIGFKIKQSNRKAGGLIAGSLDRSGVHAVGK